MDVLDAMIRYGVSLSRSVELTAQCGIGFLLLDLCILSLLMISLWIGVSCFFFIIVSVTSFIRL